VTIPNEEARTAPLKTTEKKPDSAGIVALNPAGGWDGVVLSAPGTETSLLQTARLASPAVCFRPGLPLRADIHDNPRSLAQALQSIAGHEYAGCGSAVAVSESASCKSS
jgi:hypothetical protein